MKVVVSMKDWYTSFEEISNEIAGLVMRFTMSLESMGFLRLLVGLSELSSYLTQS
jgi:hypothetical protein